MESLKERRLQDGTAQLRPSALDRLNHQKPWMSNRRQCAESMSEDVVDIGHRAASRPPVTLAAEGYAQIARWRARLAVGAFSPASRRWSRAALTLVGHAQRM